MIVDAIHKRATCMFADAPGLGQNPELQPMDRQYVRQALSFLERGRGHDVDRAARYLIRRLVDFYVVIGYVGPELINGRIELPYALMEWISEPGFAPYRASCVFDDNRLDDARIGQVYERVRFASFDFALRLAAWEAAQEVPESTPALRHGSYLAYRFLCSNMTRPWREIRRRQGSTTMRKELKLAADKMSQMSWREGKCWLGEYVQPSEAA